MDEDKDLLDKFHDPDTRENAFQVLVQRYQRQVYYQCRRMLIDHDDTNDVVQNVFIKVWKGLNGFNQESKLSTWIYRIAANESINFLNKKKASLHLSTDEYQHLLSDQVADRSTYTGEQIQLKLQQAILTLPDKQRQVFNMKYFQEMKYEEMSEILGTSVGALKASYHIAVKKIEEFIKHS
jgi:RNA polymerase sigma factor (sigma-70 family)